MKTSRLAGLLFVMAVSALGAPAAAQDGGATTTTTTTSYEVVPKATESKEPAYENSTISSVSYADIDDPDKGFYGLNLPQQQLYTGIIPRVRDGLPHLNRYNRSANRNARSKNRLTWIGYQRMSDKSRIFIQTGRNADYEVLKGQGPNELLVVLKNTRPSLSNFFRDIDCRWMYRSVGHIRSFRRGRDTVVAIKLLTTVEFSLSSDGAYVYVDFADAYLEPNGGAPEKPVDSSTVYDDPRG